MEFSPATLPPDWGDSDSESDDELVKLEPAPLTAGSEKRAVPATGGINEDDENEDFNEDDEKEEWQWTEKPPWKKVKHVENGGMWQKSSWQQKEYYKPASGGTWRNDWQSQSSWWSSSSDQWERQ